MGTYVWDQKAAEKGIERPLKTTDHAVDALRYACFSHYFNRPHTRINPEELDKWYEETRGRNTNMPRFFQDPIEGF